MDFLDSIHFIYCLLENYKNKNQNGSFYFLVCSFLLNLYLKLLYKMFIKRLNQIYAPPTLTVTQNSDSLSSIETLKVFEMCMDPHGRIIALYSQQEDRVYVVSILNLLDYIDQYRADFRKSSSYSFRKAILPNLLIQNPRVCLNIFQVKFSHCIQGTQFLVIVYYSGVIDIYSVITGKKIDSLDIMERCQNSKQGASPIFNVNVLGHSIFISTYNGNLLCYQGRQLGPCIKFQDQWVRLFHDEIEEQDSGIGGKGGKRLRKVPLYQDKNNKLRLGNREVSPIKQKHKQKEKDKGKYKRKSFMNFLEEEEEEKEERQPMTESYNEYLRLESEKAIPQGSHKKYTLSLCERYLICQTDYDYIVARKFVNSITYTVRGRYNNWAELENFEFGSKPVINQFWGIGIDPPSTKNKSKGKGKDKGKTIQVDFGNFQQYYIYSSSIIVAVVGTYDYDEDRMLNEQEQIMDERTISILKFKKTTFSYSVDTVCMITDIKENITDICWIGPNIFLYLGESGNLYYAEIDTQDLLD